MARIAWGVTGAGHLLKKTFVVMEELAKSHEITCFASSAAEAVIRMYNFWKKFPKICHGGYYSEVVLETVDGVSSPLIGRLLRGTYDILVVSPASANTVAKVVCGISDTLVTNAIAQAEKGGVPIIILPTDQKPGKTRTELPYFIDRAICKKCENCLVINVCPHGAIVLSSGLPKIDLSKCNGCGVCLKKCPHSAISFGKEILFKTRNIDIENVTKLQNNPDFIVISEPGKIPKILKGVLDGKSR